MANTESRRRDTGPGYARLFGVGFAFLLVLGVFTAIGFFVDRLLGTIPLFLILGVGVGFAGALYYLYRALGKLGGG